MIYLSLKNRIVLPFVAAETNWISNTLVLITFNMGDQDHDSFLSSIISKKHWQIQIPITVDQATPSKTMISTTKCPSSIIEK